MTEQGRCSIRKKLWIKVCNGDIKSSFASRTWLVEILFISALKDVPNNFWKLLKIELCFIAATSIVLHFCSGVANAAMTDPLWPPKQTETERNSKTKDGYGNLLSYIKDQHHSSDEWACKESEMSGSATETLRPAYITSTCDYNTLEWWLHWHL